MYVEKKTHAVVLYDSVLLSTSSGDTPSDSDTQQQVLVIAGHVEENETKKFSTVISRIILQSGSCEAVAYCTGHVVNKIPMICHHCGVESPEILCQNLIQCQRQTISGNSSIKFHCGNIYDMRY